jgi:nitrate reductase NapAB chaperone NapD
MIGWKKILEGVKYFGIIAGAVTTIGGMALFFDAVRDDMNQNINAVMDTLSEFRRVIIDYQIETKTGFEAKTGQINELIGLIKTLNRNQKIIILKSDESQQIIEEIRNQQLIEGIVNIDYLPSRDVHVIQLKKKELEL